MDVLKINGTSYPGDGLPAGEFPGVAHRRVILMDDMPVFKFIDAAGFDGRTIHTLRLAGEIYFDFKTYLKDRSSGEVLSKPGSLSELVEHLDELKLPDYRFVLNTDDKALLGDVIQRLLYLDIDLEVMLKKEEAEIGKLERFAGMYGDLQEVLDRIREYARDAAPGNAVRQYRSDLLHVVSDIETNLAGMGEKCLKVAIMALKKSGKSVVVNCLLGNEYSPASIELPTFTTCVYRKSPDNRISLDYKKGTLYFETPEALKDHVLREFKNMNSEKPEASAEEMEIRYLPREGGECNYTIIDTPGPDLAGSYHKEIAYKWIREADVVLFMIDYSKHLTKSEEEFFSDIKKVFEECRKFYSFIVVVNKLDLMYLSEEKKSGLRFIDYLRAKLHDLGYRGFIVLGVSALQYFYSLKAAQIDGGGDLLADDGKKLRRYMDGCLARYQGKDEVTVFSFLDSQIRNLLWFHGKEDATVRDLKDRSGIGRLIRYMDYISMGKVQSELFNHKMRLVDARLAELGEEFIAGRLKGLGEEGAELEKTSDETRRSSEGLAGEFRLDFQRGKLLEGIERDIKLAQKSLYKVLAMHMDDILDHLTKILKSLSGEDLTAFQKGGQIRALEKMSYRVEKKAVEKLYAPVLGKYFGTLNREIAARGSRLNVFRERTAERMVALSEYLDKNFVLKRGEITLPPVPDDFKKFDFPEIVLRLDDRFADALIRERLVRKRGFIGALLLGISFGAINSRTGGLRFDEVKLKKALYIVRKGLEDDMQAQVAEMHGRLFEQINRALDASELGQTAIVEAFEQECAGLFGDVLAYIEGLSRECEAKQAFLTDVGKKLEGFSELWQKVGA